MSDCLVKTALLIDDNEIDRFIHSKLLLHHRICENVIECDSGREGLDKLSELNKAGELPDLILLDLMMPEMDGFQFLSHYDRQVSKYHTTPLLYMVSSTEDESDLQRSKKNKHIIKLLHKPLLPDTLAKSIKTRF